MRHIVFVRASRVYDDSRCTKEIRAFVSAGYKVTVLAWDRDGYAEKKCKEVFQSLLQSVSFKFFRLEASNGLGIKNIDKLIKWFRWVYRNLRECADCDIVHACDLDTGLPSYVFCKKYKKEMVYDIFDYYVDSHSIPVFLRNTIEKMEINVINNAAATIICTEERKVQISKATPVRLSVIHNSPDILKIFEVSEKYDYAYCGALKGKRLIDEILSEYPDNSDLRFCFAGSGVYNARARDLDSQYENFSFFGARSYDEVLRLENDAAILSAIYEPTIRNHQLCAPNKFYEALALGKPVIVCRGTGIDRIVEEQRIGIVINYDVAEFYEAVKQLKSNSTMAKEMGLRARKLYEENYTWAQMQDRLLKLYDDIFANI